MTVVRIALSRIFSIFFFLLLTASMSAQPGFEDDVVDEAEPEPSVPIDNHIAGAFAGAMAMGYYFTTRNKKITQIKTAVKYTS